jgi:interleukin enhancer-binding factor 2
MLDVSETFPLVATPARLYSELAAALHQRNNEIVNAISKKNVLNELAFFVMRVEDSIKKFQNAPQSFTKMPIEKVIRVGSFRNGTMRADHLSADLVVILTYFPTEHTIEYFMKRLRDSLDITLKNELNYQKFGDLSWDKDEKGFALSSQLATVYLLFAVTPENANNIIGSAMKLHMSRSLAAVRHSVYLEHHSNATVKILARILRDIASRYQYIALLNPWMIDLLSYQATFENFTYHPLPLHQSFLRVFSLLAAGLFTPTSNGLMDPCEDYSCSIHDHLTFEQQENLMKEAQAILMKILREEFWEVLNTKDELEVFQPPYRFDLEEEIRIKLETDSGEEKNSSYSESEVTFVENEVKTEDESVLKQEPFMKMETSYEGTLFKNEAVKEESTIKMEDLAPIDIKAEVKTELKSQESDVMIIENPDTSIISID